MRTWRRPFGRSGAGVVWGLVLAANAAVAADFDQQIAPLLARHCADCHNSTDRKGGLDLTRRQAALEGGESGPAIVPERAADSPLIQRVEADEMPPRHPLTAADKRLLRQWIDAGARWGVDPLDPFRYSSERRGGYDWWSFQPLGKSLPPAVPGAPSAIDAWIRATLADRQLTPSPPASPTVLLRRLYFDLLGLPPDPEELADFAAATEPDATARLVDRLLARPALGERWARHWLDIAHFGESDGFEYDRLRPQAWPYRDWVIQAFNADLPYDEFARLQVAGDVLQPDQPAAVTATGFLVGGAHDGLMPAGDVMKQIMRQDELEDLVATFGLTFLGLTVHCGRCHDHKFDPIRQTDYYGLASALGGVKRGERPLPVTSETAALERRLADYQQELQQLEEPARQAVLARRAGAAAAPRPLPPQPIAAWDFTRELRDQVGQLHGQLQGGARRDESGLVLDGQTAYLSTAPLDRPLAAKTLSAVVQLARLDQGGGGVVSVQTLDGGIFDAIVFGEREPRRWMAGSNGFVRTQSFQGPEEQLAARDPLHVAWVYDAQGTITGYVAGQPYGTPYRTTLQTYEAGRAQLVFGLRHAPVGGNRMLAGRVLRAALYDRALTADEVARAAASMSDFVSAAELAEQLGPAGRERREWLRGQMTALRDAVTRWRAGRVFAITPQAAPVTHVLARGNPLKPGAAVAPAGLSSVVGLPASFELPADAPEAQRRLRLADWVTDRRNPLFSRAIVNRLWHYHFGQGLVSTPNDLGFSGGPPSHPALLDALATELLRDFSLKRLHRELVLSATYGQSSAPRDAALAVDADNRLWWRMNPRRLEAEAVRDAMLAVAGELNRQMSGPGYHDFRAFLRGGTQFYEPLDPAGAAYQRRSVYRTWARGGHNRLLDTFDCPDPSTSTPRRSVTTTPLQALALLNNSFVLRMADAFAERARRDVAEEAGGGGAAEAAATRRLFQLAYGRAPLPAEEGASVEFARRHGLAALARIVLNANAFVYVE